MPHIIRLRHPWQCESTDAGAVWLRTFNWPAGLEENETAQLVIEKLPSQAKLTLNEHALAAQSVGRFDITDILDRYNRLAIEVDGAELTDQTECPYNVQLEIEAS